MPEISEGISNHADYKVPIRTKNVKNTKEIEGRWENMLSEFLKSPDFKIIFSGLLRKKFARILDEENVEFDDLISEMYIVLQKYSFLKEKILSGNTFNQHRGLILQAAESMLTDRLRSVKRQKRGGDYQRIPFEVIKDVTAKSEKNILQRVILSDLKKRHLEETEIAVLELVYSEGLSSKEAAKILRKSVSTVERAKKSAIEKLQAIYNPDKNDKSK